MKEGKNMNQTIPVMLLAALFTIIGFLLFVIGFGENFLMALAGILFLILAMLTIKKLTVYHDH